jgi:hypothetical protein
MLFEEGWEILGESKVTFIKNQDQIDVNNSNRFTANYRTTGNILKGRANVLLFGKRYVQPVIHTIPIQQYIK